MSESLRSCGLPALLGAVMLALAGAEVRAQNPYVQVSPNVVNNTRMLGRAAANMPVNVGVPGQGGAVGTLGTAPGVGSVPFSNPPVGGVPFSPYGWPGFESPIGGFMNGTANIISSQGQFMVNQQQANILQQQAQAGKIDNRRRVFDNYLYERAMTPTVEQFREEDRLRNLDRSLINPPVNEIYSGAALNNILVDLQVIGGGRPSSDPHLYVPVNPYALRQINVTVGQNPGNVGLLQSGEWKNWPLVLEDDTFKTYREHLDKLVPQAIEQATRNGRVDGQTLRLLTETVNSLRETLRANVGTIGSNDYIRALRFVNDLQSAVTGLQDATVGNQFNGRFTLQGETASDVVRFMTDNGLRFAAATPGDEPAYLALQRALATYHQNLKAVMGQRAAGTAPSQGTKQQ